MPRIKKELENVDIDRDISNDITYYSAKTLKLVRYDELTSIINYLIQKRDDEYSE